MCRKHRSREVRDAIDMWAGLCAQLGEACALSLVREYQTFSLGYSLPFAPGCNGANVPSALRVEAIASCVLGSYHGLLIGSEAKNNIFLPISLFVLLPS